MRTADARTVLLLGAGVMRATDLATQLVERFAGQTPYPYVKTGFAAGLALLGASRMADDRREQLLLAGGVAAVAAYLHDVRSLLDLSGKVDEPRVVGGRRGSGYGVPPL